MHFYKVYTVDQKSKAIYKSNIVIPKECSHSNRTMVRLCSTVTNRFVLLPKKDFYALYLLRAINFLHRQMSILSFI